MTAPTSSTSKRPLLIVVAVLLLIIAVGLVIASGRNEDTTAQSQNQTATVVKAIVGSEKKDYLNDPRVQDILAKHGYHLDVQTAGSREIASRDLSGYDLAFPSSSPAAEKITSTHPGTLGTRSPFHSPMAIATFTPIMDILKSKGVASQKEGTWYVDMNAYRDLSDSGTRWAQLSPTYPSPSTVKIISTDLSSSNSAAMYMSLLSWVSNHGAVVDPQNAPQVAKDISKNFTSQGYSESSSSTPFEQYLSQGMGSRPLVMIYESQFLGEKMREHSRLSSDMVLAYPSPTVYSEHTTVALTPQGRTIADLLCDDPDLQSLAAEYGFRPSDPVLWTRTLDDHAVPHPPTILATGELPSYDTMETMISTITGKK